MKKEPKNIKFISLRHNCGYYIIILVILIFITQTTIQSDELNPFLNSSSFHYRFDSFYGTEFFPDQDYKKYNYFDVNILRAGWAYKFNNDFSVCLDLKINDKLFEKEILLDKTGITYTKNNLFISYKYGHLKYGKDSYIYNLSVKDRFYDVGVLEDYRYQGVVVDWKPSNFSLGSKLAANNYHTAILDNSVTYTHKNNKIVLFSLFVPRDYEYNDINMSLGSEIDYEINNISFYGAYVYKMILDKNRDDKIKILNEIIFNPSKNLSLGSNIFAEGFMKLQNWQMQSFLRIMFGSLNNFIMFRYSSIDEFTTPTIDRELNILNIYSISNEFSLGLNVSYLYPSFDKSHFQFGVQAKIIYETN